MASRQPTALPERPQQPGPAAWLRRKLPVLIVLLAAALIFLAAYLVAHDSGSPIHQATSTYYEHASYENGKVINISDDTVEVARDSLEGYNQGSQTLLIRMTTGKHTGENLTATNFVGALYGAPLREGDDVTVLLHEDEESGEITVTVYEVNRTVAVCAVLLAFLVITVLVGGKTGLKSLAGLALTVVCLIWILCPLLMKGYPVIPTTFFVCVYVSVVSFVFLDGINRKTVCAMLGTVAGTGLAACFGMLAQTLARVDGYRAADLGPVEALLQIQQQGIPLHIRGLLTGGVLIASLGAVMDVAMSLSSSIQELKTVNPTLHTKELWKSAMRIGRDMVGTMTNTLILAFVGSSFILILYLWSLGLSFYQLVSSPFLSIELISSVSSSIGVILAVPLTSLIGSVLFGRPQGAI